MRRGFRTLVLVGGLLCATRHATAQLGGGQPPVAHDEPTGGEVILERVPTPEEGVRAFNAAQAWMLAGSVPERASIEGGPISVGGVSVTIRYAGRVVGRGMSFERACDLAIGEAMREALKDAEDRVPLAVDDEMRFEQLRSATLTLELAGPMTPIAPDALADIGLTLSPGIDGVSARLGQRTEAIFPEQMLLAGMDARVALGSLAGAISGSPADAMRDPARTRRDLGISFMSFRTVHLTQTRPGQPAVPLYRGSRVPTSGSLDFAELHRMSDGIAAHLASRAASRSRSDTRRLGTPGAYLPVSDRFETESAPAAEQALVALALWSHSQTPGTRVSAAALSRGAAASLVADLAVVEPDEMAPEISGAGAAMTSVAVRRIMGDGALPEDIAGMLSRCDRTLDEWAEAFLARSRTTQAGQGEADIGGDAGLIAWALAERAVTLEGPASEAERSRAVSVVREVFLASAGPRLVSQMPWLAWADATLTPQGEPIPSTDGLVQLRRTIWAHQLKAEDVGAEGADLVGGIVLSSGGAVLPTWQSLRVATLGAWMLGEPRLTPPTDVVPELSRVLAGMEFLRRLAADETTCHMYPSPHTAMWGVRVATWDQRMTPEASAMGLLSVSHLLKSVSRIAEHSSNATTPAEPGEEP